MLDTNQNSAVITASNGAGETVTTGALTGMQSCTFDFANETLQVLCNQGAPIYDISDATTVTLVLTAGVWVLTVS